MTAVKTPRAQVADLARPLSKYVRPAPAGRYGSYIPHYVITQALLAYVGPYDWQLVEIVRGEASGTIDGSLVERSDVVVGAVYRLTVYMGPDRLPFTVEEVGEVTSAHLNMTDGARLKKASSDAIKRCAMRLGLGLHLWCKTHDEYFLRTFLTRTDGDMGDEQEVVVGVEGDDE